MKQDSDKVLVLVGRTAKEPEYGPWRRSFESARRRYFSLSRLHVWILTRGLVFLFLDLLLFVAVAAWKGGSLALNVTLGVVSPLDVVGWAEWLAVALAVLSWLLVPALVGAIVAALLESAVRAQSADMVREKIEEIFQRDRNRPNQ